MRKMRPDSIWNRLTAEQKSRLEHWLFEENIRYVDALERVEREFGFKASMRSLADYYKRLCKEHIAKETIRARGVFGTFETEEDVWREIRARQRINLRKRAGRGGFTRKSNERIGPISG